MLFRHVLRTLPAFFLVPALFLLGFLVAVPGVQAAEDGFVSHPCPIEGQEKAVVLGAHGSFQAACLALSTPHNAGPWPPEDTGRITGSSRFCPRAVLTVLDQSGAMTVRFLPAPKESFLADPAACCHAAEISVDPADGRVRIASAAPTADEPARSCFGGPAEGSVEDLYRWDGSELKFLESRHEGANPAE